MGKGIKKGKDRGKYNTEELLIGKIERLISDISNSVIDDMSFPGVSYGQTKPTMTTIQSNGNGEIGLSEGVGYSGISSVPTLTLMDVYEHLQETNSDINKTLIKFRISLDNSTDNHMVNRAIVNFTKDFYSLRDRLNSQIALYNTVYFTTSQELEVGKLYIEQCLNGLDKDICLSNLIKNGLTN
jgi:hypothetical protein